MSARNGTPTTEVTTVADRGDRWWLVQEQTVDSLWATYAGPFGARKDAWNMHDVAVARHVGAFRVVCCHVEAEPGPDED